VVKMILETAQLLYTAHWILALAAGRVPDLSTAPQRKEGPRGYLPIRNAKHPCAIWARESLAHYRWLCALGIALCQEYQHRFGADKVHGCEEHLFWLNRNPPAQLAAVDWIRQPPQAMPVEYQRSKNSIVAYRAYYKENKGAVRGILKYTARHQPHWLGGRA
jgi:hypothetical protein